MVQLNRCHEARIHFERGDYQRALEVFRHELRRAEAAGDAEQAAAALAGLGFIEHFRGRIESALEHGRSQLSLLRRQSDDAASASVLNHLGMLHLEAKQVAQAELSFRSAFMLAQRIGDAALRSHIQLNRARHALAQGQLQDAHHYCDDAFQEHSRAGSEAGLSEAYLVYGILYRENGETDLATTHFQLAITLARACGHGVLQAEAEREHARLYMQSGLLDDALDAVTRAQALLHGLLEIGQLADAQRKLDRLARMHRNIVDRLETECSLN